MLHTAIHLALDPFTPDGLAALGVTNVARVTECLLVGPCALDPADNARQRHAYWTLWGSDSHEEWDRLYAPDVGWDRPVVVWVSSSATQRLNLWRILHYLRHRGVAQQDVHVVETAPRVRAEPSPFPIDCADSVTDHPDEVLLALLAQAEPWPGERYDRAVQLWETFVDPDPSRFALLCAHGEESFPELGDLWLLLSCYYPRRGVDGALRLSVFDGLIFATLSAEAWQTPVDLFVQPSEAGLALRNFLSCTGDLHLPERLDRWVQHGLVASVERAPGTRHDGAMTRFAYRLTAHGERLRSRGLVSLNEAPSFALAGCEAYTSPWVLLDDGTLSLLPS
jgi:hypothetical protein